MRLTLRTLIAYLDDILDPEQTREIGQKIAESEVAQDLVNRVKEVLRRRRLTAPTLQTDSANIDANRIAEYLDNTLSPVDVAEVEKVCLESDMHLAEVSACHQILTLVLGEPVDIVPESREKMYSLGPKPAPSDHPDSTAATSGSRIVSATREATIPVGKVELSARSCPQAQTENASSLEVPRKSLGKRAIPVVIVLLFVGTLTGLLLTDSSFKEWIRKWGQSDSTDLNLVVKKDSESNSALGENERNLENNHTGTEPKAPKQDKKEGQKKKVSNNGNDLPMPILPDDFDPKPPKVLPDKVANNSTAIGKTQPGTDAKQIANEQSSKKAPKPEVPSMQMEIQVEKPVIVKKAPVRFLYKRADSTGMLWKFEKSKNDFVYTHPETVIVPHEKLIVPEPLTAELQSDLGVLLSFRGGSSFTVLPSDQLSHWGIDLKQGRLKIRRDSSLAVKPNPTQPLTVAVILGGKLHYISLESPDAELGIEVTPSLANGFEKSSGEDVISGGIYSVTGIVKVTDYDGRTWELKADRKRKDWMPLAPSVRKEFGKPGSSVPGLIELPTWLSNSPPKADVSNLAKNFQNEFEIDRTFTENVLAVARDRRPHIAELAVKSLAVANQHEELIKILAQSTHKEAKLEAYLGLRRWLPEDPAGNGKTLQESLKLHFRSPSVVPLYRLIWGIERKDVLNPRNSEDFIDWLDHPELLVRELTFHQITSLTNLKFSYRPSFKANQRKLPIKRFRNHLKRNGALLVVKKNKVEPKKTTKSKKQKPKTGK